MKSNNISSSYLNVVVVFVVATMVPPAHGLLLRSNLWSTRTAAFVAASTSKRSLRTSTTTSLFAPPSSTKASFRTRGRTLVDRSRRVASLGPVPTRDSGAATTAAVRFASSRPRFGSDDDDADDADADVDASSSVETAPRSLVLRVDAPEDMEDVGSVLSVGAGPGDVVLLDGDLGAGKTCLARGFVRARLGDFDARVTSPTYLLSNSYVVRRTDDDDDDDDEEDVVVIHHMDLYRLSGSPSDLEPLDLPRVFSECVSLVEWPSRLGDARPNDRLEIDVTIDETTGERTLTLSPFGDGWTGRLARVEDEGYLDDLVVSDDDDDDD